MYFVICFALYLILNFICIIKVRFQFLFFQAFNDPGVSLVPGLAVPRTTVPKLSINHTELVNFILAIVSTGTISVGKQSKRTTTFVPELQYNISEKENLGVKQKSLTHSCLSILIGNKL
jgi:hypothetical protein